VQKSAMKAPTTVRLALNPPSEYWCSQVNSSSVPDSEIDLAGLVG
jgi:hypothetical protein